MVKKNNKVLYISIISTSVIIIGIVVWGFMTNWKFWNHKKEKTSKLPKLHTCDEGYVPVNDGKCCLQEYTFYDVNRKEVICKKPCGDKQYCLETENCLTVPETNNKKCCPYDYVQNNGRCCKDGEILDKHKKCCPKNNLVNDVCCYSPGEIVDDNGQNTCKIKCDNIMCDLDKKCSTDGNTCETKNCNIDMAEKKYLNYEDGKRASEGVNGCAISDSNVKKTVNNKGNCQYPVYNDTDKKYSFIYLNDKYTKNIDKKNYTATYEQTTSGCTKNDCPGIKNNVCDVIEQVPVISNNESKCPFNNEKRCCKTKEGEYTGQICDGVSRCIVDNTTELGKCVTALDKCTKTNDGKTCQNGGKIKGNLYDENCHCDCDDTKHYGDICQTKYKTFDDFNKLFYQNPYKKIDFITTQDHESYTIQFTGFQSDEYYNKDAIQQICKNTYYFYDATPSDICRQI